MYLYHKNKLFGIEIKKSETTRVSAQYEKPDQMYGSAHTIILDIPFVHMEVWTEGG